MLATRAYTTWIRSDLDGVAKLRTASTLIQDASRSEVAHYLGVSTADIKHVDFPQLALFAQSLVRGHLLSEAVSDFFFLLGAPKSRYRWLLLARDFQELRVNCSATVGQGLDALLREGQLPHAVADVESAIAPLMGAIVTWPGIKSASQVPLLSSALRTLEGASVSVRQYLNEQLSVFHGDKLVELDRSRNRTASVVRALNSACKDMF